MKDREQQGILWELSEKFVCLKLAKKKSMKRTSSFEYIKVNEEKEKQIMAPEEWIPNSTHHQN